MKIIRGIKAEFIATENKKRKMVLSILDGKFEHPNGKGIFYCGGNLFLLNMDDGRQFQFKLADVVEAILTKIPKHGKGNL